MKVEYSRIGAAESQSMESAIHELLYSTHPAKSIRAVIERGQKSTATAFEQYASDVLCNAGGHRLASEPQAQSLKIIAPENGRLAQLACAGVLPSRTQATVLATECALNRLVCIADAITDGISEKSPAKERIKRSISILGGGYIQSGAGYRSAHITLPPLTSSTDISPAYYNELDWRCTDNVTSNGRAVFQRSMKPNAYRTTLGVQVHTQSDWDVRTRLAQILSALELPFRYSFRFDYDSVSKAVMATYTCPPVGFLPKVFGTRADGTEEPDIQHAYESYLLRLSCLFIAGCFGSGRYIEHATVVGFTTAWDKPLVSVQFNRDSFVRSTLMAIDSHEIADPSLRFDPSSVAGLMSATHLDWTGRSDVRGAHVVSIPPAKHSICRMDPWLDERELSKDAQDIFHCKRICDVDTSHYLGGHASAIDLARSDADESSLAAIARLESLVEDLEARMRAQCVDELSRPLYAADPLSRLAVVLLDDELSIASEAEAFMQGNIEALPAEGNRPLYVRAPSALYHARYGLSDLYQHIGDFHAAMLQADRCISLAPTTAGAYYRKADILAEQGFFTQAANVLIDGLRCCAVREDCALLYYHLGMLLWNIDKKRAACAVHSYNTSLAGEYAEKSEHVLCGIRKNADAPESVGMSAFDASHELARMRLPVSPVNMKHLIAQATILLANSGNARAAAPYAHELERLNKTDDIIVAACRSIQSGVTLG